MASVERGEVPPQELVKNYKVLRGGNYLRVPGELPRELARLDFELATGA